MAGQRSGGLLSVPLGTLYSLGTVGGLSDGQLLGRFLDREDAAESEAAFAVLVERHGEMVLRVCQRILGDSHDVQDASQATFLLLVRKAGSIRSRESVGEWLFRIARRVAVRAGIDAARRRRRIEDLAAERQDALVTPPINPPITEPDHAALIAEVDRLPERFRAAVVLYYFEGLSTEATAQRLGCARGTVLSRLSRARDRLRSRLERRGVSLESVWPVGAAADRLAWSGTVPSSLVHNTIRAAVSLSLAGAAIESVVPATVAALARGAARTLVLSRVRAVACLFILAAVGVSIGLAASLKTAEEPSRPAAGGSQPRWKARENPVVVRGQVLDPDGKPVAGASIVLTGPSYRRPPDRLAASSADGRFEVAIPPAAIEGHGADDDLATYLAALAPGFGPGWVEVDRRAATKPVAIRLVRDDIPIEGRILNLEGRGVPGARISIYAIADLPDGFLTTLRSDAGQADPNGLWIDLLGKQLMLDRAGPPAAVRTGPDGRFRMIGLGRDRIAALTVEGESIETLDFRVVTTGDPAYTPLTVSLDDCEPFKLYGPRFELAVAPGRAIEGIVRDHDTGRPIPGAKVGLSLSLDDTTCDGQGRFRLTGMSRNKGNFLEVVADDQPYVKVDKPVGDPKGFGPVQADVELKRGVWVEGKLIDKSSGRPVKAIVHYVAFRDNPHVKDYPDATIYHGPGLFDPEYRTDADGRFRAVALPGGGILVVRSLEPGYLIAKPLTPKAAANVLDPANFFMQDSSHALVPINPRPGEVLVLPDITLIAGRPQHVRPVGPDGRPVERTLSFGEKGRTWRGDVVPGDEFTFVHPRPGQPETVLILSENRELGALVDIKGDEPDPIKVALQPSGTVTGRLVDEDGRPRPNVRLELEYQRRTRGDTESDEQHFSPPLLTGPDGRFRIRGLVPGVSYTVAVIRKGAKDDEHRYEGNVHSDLWTLKPGEVQDWGDIRVTN